MDDQQLLRYSRQIMLPQIDIEGQERLGRSRALIIGLGGLGSPVALYLAAAGVGELVLADFDRVDLTNLQRQIIHRGADIGRLKVESAADAIAAVNPEARVQVIAAPLDGDNLAVEVSKVDVVIDCTDNFATRFAANAACVAAKVPLVFGAAIRFEGQLAVFRADRDESPCYRCLFPGGEDEAETCSETGVLSPLPGVIGTLQAVEAIKVLLGIGEDLSGRLVLFDALGGRWRTLSVPRDPQCPICASR